MDNEILYTKLSSEGDLLSPSYPGDAGLNVVTSKSCIAYVGQLTKVDLGIAVAVPEKLAFTFLTRSGAVANGLFVLPTLIDSGYRGPLFLFVVNFGQQPIRIEQGTSIAQLVLIDNHSNITKKLVDELPSSIRGINGFNSSGGGIKVPEGAVSS